ncbi:class II fructose-bisphosphate aldolase [Garciella nitratireducens]|uniref:Fructose-bisphosphate aldolase, class II n=1 Tax=Garciella nitratireducens DSM 15102 TaxID=1121911 RepID=A0A1T4P9I2_9FIRM|nr:class II fructose-bisphosphate aldolase [Garciella nitratireducens]SJZ88225.1 fructose-bisphosphate aldolase, class II [Garciella nitratireducens DSM 15102]
MTLVNTKKILEEARIKKYAIGAFNVTTLEAIRGIIAAAEQEKSPVIMEFAQAHEKFVPLKTIGPIMVQAAKDAKVPVAVHFDHGTDFQLILQALKMGFTSVMIDGAALPYEENVKKTQKVVEVAHALGATVEAELGRVEDSGSFQCQEEDLYTNPKMAIDFEKQTGIDLLAVSFGTAHGLYIEKPCLDFERLKEISQSVSIPLVMHGGSGLLREEYQESISKGICKINYYSDLAHLVAKEVAKRLMEAEKLGKEIYIHDISTWSIEIIQRDVAEKMKIFGSTGVLEGRME